MSARHTEADVLLDRAENLLKKEQLEAKLSTLQESLTLYRNNRNASNSSEEGDCLYEIGLVNYQLRQYPETLKYYKQALPIMREASNLVGEEAVLNNIAAVYRSLNQYSQALEYLNQTLEVQQKVGDRLRLGLTLSNLGGLHYFLSHYSQAIEFFQKALANWRELDQIEDEGRDLNNIAAVYLSLCQYDRALDFFQQSLAIWLNLGNRQQSARSINNIGEVYRHKSQYDEALENYQNALRIRQELGDFLGIATTLNNIATVYISWDRYAKALKFYDRALAIRQKAKDRIGIGQTLNNMGEAYRSLGQPEHSLEFFQKAIEVWQAIENLNGEAIALNNIGVIYQKIGRLAEALKSHQKALKILKEIGDRAVEGRTLNNIGTIYQRLSQFDKAFKLHQDALNIFSKIRNREGIGKSLNLLGLAYLRSGQYAESIEKCQQGLTIAREIGNRADTGVVLSNIGLAYERQNDKLSAIDYYENSIVIKESVQGDIKIEELKSSFASEQIGFYNHLINLLSKEARFKESFNYVERSRARAFLDQLANGPLDFRTNTSTELLNKERALKNEISARRTQLVKLRNRPNSEWDTEAISTVQNQLTKREQEYTNLLTKLKLQSPEIASLVSVDVASLEEIQNGLDTETTLVEYFVIDDRTLAFIITCKTFETVALDPDLEALTQTIEALRNLDLDPYSDHYHLESLKQLYQWLIAPLHSNLATTKLTIVPHSVLHYLPFAALSDGDRYLIDDYTLTLLPSASTLRFLPKKRKPDATTILALGDPKTDEPGLRPLRFAKQEVNKIARLYKSAPLVETAATETALRSRAIEAGILHLSAHAKYNKHNPQFSTIYLAPDDRYDGRLEVHDIYSLDLTANTNLVVLSACQTQVGKLSKGDEVVALNRAFLYAGTPSVMATLWMVDDRATGMLMEQFYTHLRSGASKAEALRQAQREVRQEYPHPYFWAAFTLTGDGGR